LLAVCLNQFPAILVYLLSSQSLSAIHVTGFLLGYGGVWMVEVEAE
jgi:hypothetical protein